MKLDVSCSLGIVAALAVACSSPPPNSDFVQIESMRVVGSNMFQVREGSHAAVLLQGSVKWTPFFRPP
ncbi:MAG: hypothetical protein JST54_17840 [Deltaproteobacteria bacterium]|nr:hypothetical protein [Deltaproteobacteria bacterium]